MITNNLNTLIKKQGKITTNGLLLSYTYDDIFIPNSPKTFKINYIHSFLLDPIMAVLFSFQLFFLTFLTIYQIAKQSKIIDIRKIAFR